MDSGCTMFEDIRRIGIDLLIEDDEKSYVVVEFMDDDLLEEGEHEIIFQTTSASEALKWCMDNFGEEDELYIPDTIHEILTLDAQQKLLDIHNMDEEEEIDWDDGVTRVMIEKIIRAIEQEFQQEENGDDIDDEYEEI